jgi:hypothetical protein
MHIDFWASVGIVCGAVLTAATLVTQAYRKVVRPLWRYLAGTFRRTNAAADSLLGDKAKGIPSITERMTRVEAGQSRLEDGAALLAERLTAVEEALDRNVKWRAAAGTQRPVDPNGRRRPATHD